MRLSLLMLLLEVPMHIALILIVLGPLPDLDSALYVTAVVLFLFEAGFFLLTLVYSQGRPAAA